ncbi:MAG: sulfatase-like hydrolase/transferase, partial [Acidobacteriota bacterium]
AVVAAAIVGWQFAERSKPVAGPIILISIDTLRADRLPVYGYAGGETPAIDELARSSVVFERAYAHSPQTLPSHASMLTGRLPFEHGVRDNVGFTLSEQHPSLATLLSARGFETGAGVSAYVLRAETGIGRGFGTYDAEIDPGPADAPATLVARDGSVTVDNAIRWLEGRGGERFFQFLHLYEPHAPYAPPPRFGAAAHPYDGEIAYADSLVGRITEHLKRRGLFDRALIILTADHGEGLGDHGEQEHGLFLYDEAVRVPLLVKMPEARRSPDGPLRRVTAPVQHIDLVPTVLDLVRAPVPPGLRGRSLRGMLEREDAELAPQGIYAEAMYGRLQFGWAELQSLTDDRFRYIRAPRAELYDLANDPDERVNLEPERQATALAMAGALDRLVAGSRLGEPAPVATIDLEKFAALGYVGIQPRAPAAPDAVRPDPKDMVGVLEAYRRAAQLTIARAFDEALAVLTAIVEQRPELADVWSEIGRLQLRAGRAEAALASLRQVVVLHPEDPAALVAVGDVLARLGRLDQAARHASLAIEVAAGQKDASGRAAAYELAVRVALARQQPEEAARLAAEAAEANPALRLDEYVEGRVLYAREELEAAVAKFEAVAAAEAGGVRIRELHWYLGDALARLERYPEAERAFQEELRRSPQNGRAYASLAMLYRASNRPDDAVRTVEALTDALPTPEGDALAIRLWTLLGESDRAQAIRRRARR